MLKCQGIRLGQGTLIYEAEVLNWTLANYLGPLTQGPHVLDSQPLWAVVLHEL